MIAANVVLVLGEFRWLPAASNDTLTFSYGALLNRRDGQWGVRFENEILKPALK